MSNCCRQSFPDALASWVISFARISCTRGTRLAHRLHGIPAPTWTSITVRDTALSPALRDLVLIIASCTCARLVCCHRQHWLAITGMCRRCAHHLVGFTPLLSAYCLSHTAPSNLPTLLRVSPTVRWRSAVRFGFAPRSAVLTDNPPPPQLHRRGPTHCRLLQRTPNNLCCSA